MKITYDTCDQLRLVRGKLIHPETGREWIESKTPCKCCGDDFMHVAGKVGVYCEPHCASIGPQNSLKIRQMLGVKTINTKLGEKRNCGKFNTKLSKAIKEVYHKKREDQQKEFADEQQNTLNDIKELETVNAVVIRSVQKMLGPRKRHPLSEEHKRKISEATRGKKRSMETRMKMSRTRKGRKVAILMKDEMLPEQIEALKRSGQDIGVIATIAVKEKHSQLIERGKTLIERFKSLFRRG